MYLAINMPHNQTYVCTLRIFIYDNVMKFENDLIVLETPIKIQRRQKHAEQKYRVVIFKHLKYVL